MSTTAAFSNQLRDAFLRPTRGVVGLVDDLLAVCGGHDLELELQASRFRVRSRGGEWEELQDVAVRESVIRAILARVAALCNERIPNSVSPYGGQGELTSAENPDVVFHVAFSNTGSEQMLRMTSQVGAVADAEANADPWAPTSTPAGPAAQPSAALSFSGATFRIRTSVGMFHALAASYFARQLRGIEDDKLTPYDGERHAAHVSYAVGGVISAAGFMEGMINEFYVDAGEETPELVARIGSERLPLVRAFWSQIERQGVLEKYQLALALCGQPAFDSGAQLYEDAKAVIILRNALVHYRPEWDTDQDEHAKIAKRLSGKFVLNPFADGNAAFFPRRCLGHGCVAWAIGASLELVRTFFDRAGLPGRRSSIDAQGALLSTK